MNRVSRMTIAMAISALVTATTVAADEPAPVAPSRPIIPHHAPPTIPALEPEDAPVTATSNRVASSSPQATTLSPPVTLTYSGSSNALTVTDSGTGRGISASVTDTNSGSSALVGSTVGSGAGLTGINSGTGGPAGKFEVTNANSGQAGVFATTNGSGSAILGTITSQTSSSAAILGINMGDANAYGTGVEGEGNTTGVVGSSGSGTGVLGSSEVGNGVYGSSTNANGVEGYSINGFGVAGYSENDIAVYGSSTGAYAGYFVGVVTATSYTTMSDKNAKTAFKDVDNKDILDKVSRLPITGWEFKTDKKQLRHLGPMAQDFHSQFGLDGDDDKHINLGDMAGVTLAAVQELNKQMKQKNAEIAELKTQLAAQAEAFSARLTALEQGRGTSIQTASLKQ